MNSESRQDKPPYVPRGYEDIEKARRVISRKQKGESKSREEIYMAGNQAPRIYKFGSDSGIEVHMLQLREWEGVQVGDQIRIRKDMVSKIPWGAVGAALGDKNIIAGFRYDPNIVNEHREEYARKEVVVQIDDNHVWCISLDELKKYYEPVSRNLTDWGVKE